MTRATPGADLKWHRQCVGGMPTRHDLRHLGEPGQSGFELGSVEQTSFTVRILRTEVVEVDSHPLWSPPRPGPDQRCSGNGIQLRLEMTVVTTGSRAVFHDHRSPILFAPGGIECAGKCDRHRLRVLSTLGIDPDTGCHQREPGP
jgi:hypothetical protein